MIAVFDMLPSPSGKAVVNNFTPSVQTILTEEIHRQQECVASCSQLCTDIQNALDVRIGPAITQLMGTQVQTPKTAYSEESRSGVGIALRGCRIESFLPGVPASKLMNVGDEIVEVDGVVMK